MLSKNVICVVVERLHVGMLGAYGNSWIRTPAIDDLASESFVFDQAFVERPSVEAFYNAVWMGDNSGTQSSSPDAGISLPQRLKAKGFRTALITDSQSLAESELVTQFDEKLFIESPEKIQSAVDASETAFGRLMSSASEWLTNAPAPFLLWVHCQAMSGPWDAPLKMRDRFAEEDDPLPPSIIEMPNYWLPDDYDPDELLGIRHAYAGQVNLLDDCLGAFLECLDSGSLRENTLFTFLSSNGFPLGEHHRIGPCDEALYNELIQLAWMMRFPGGMGRLTRSQALVRPEDLPAGLLGWIDIGESALSPPGGLMGLIRRDVSQLRDRLLFVSPHDQAVRTKSWHLRQPLTGAPELYAKPSDRWEVNEVANLLPSVVEGLLAALPCSENQRCGETPLADFLTNEEE